MKTKKEMKAYLVKHIKETIFGEGGMLWLARGLEYGFGDEQDAEKPLADGDTPENAGNIVWERGRTRDALRFGESQGHLHGLWSLAADWKITLPEEVEKLGDWRYAIVPA
jgi:hypothetical protein